MRKSQGLSVRHLVFLGFVYLSCFPSSFCVRLWTTRSPESRLGGGLVGWAGLVVSQEGLSSLGWVGFPALAGSGTPGCLRVAIWGGGGGGASLSFLGLRVWRVLG